MVVATLRHIKARLYKVCIFCKRSDLKIQSDFFFELRQVFSKLEDELQPKRPSTLKAFIGKILRYKGRT